MKDNKQVTIKTSKTKIRKILKAFNLEWMGKYDISIQIVEDKNDKQ